MRSFVYSSTLVLLALPLCAMDPNPQIAQKIDGVISILTECKGRTWPSCMPASAQQEFKNGFTLLKEFHGTLANKPNWNLLENVTFHLNKAHSARVEKCEWSQRCKKYVMGTRTIRWPLAAYVYAIVCNIKSDYERSFSLLKSVYSPYLPKPLSQHIPYELMQLAYDIKLPQAQKYLMNYPQITSGLVNELQQQNARIRANKKANTGLQAMLITVAPCTP